jgi:hypothetical protein
MADEIEHARLCFALASAYARRPLGPGQLAIDDALAGADDLVAAAVAAVHEGCVDETLAALQAEAARAAATDPAVRRALDRIADDEARHAALAWRFVRWAIDTGGEEVRTAVAAAFADALSREVPTPGRARDRADSDAIACPRHGRLGGDELARLARAGRRDVVADAAARLLAPSDRGQAPSAMLRT